MCGIFGYIGSKNSIKVTLQGLKRLEYRGYDSAGIAGIKNGKIVYRKEVGKVANLEEEVERSHLDLELAIAQTRWATHGKVTQVNAHPHLDTHQTLALVHNGIIENHDILKRQLQEKGVKFISDTDTEVIAQLIASLYQGDILQAVQQAIGLLKGSYAIALIHQDFPNQIIAVAHEAPLVIGIGNHEAFISSDPHAFAFHTRQVIYLMNAEIAVIKADQQEIYNADQDPIVKESQWLEKLSADQSKGEFEHYTLKEIFEQPQAIRSALLARFSLDQGTAVFDELNFSQLNLMAAERILILACGTSWHAGYLASYLLEDKARLPVQVEISSEFRYKNPVVSSGTLVIAISQSGETADTIAAVREVKSKGSQVLAICNVQGSTLVREADSSIFLRAGAEIGVCSTKAFTSQVTVLSLLTLLLARMRHMSKSEGQEFIHALLKLPDQVQWILDKAATIEALAKRYAHYEHFFYLGRHFMYPTSLEGALKLKEIAYVNANGYPAGEMKHGPIALIDKSCLTVALCANQLTFDKMVSNLMEIKARDGQILSIVEDNQTSLEKIVDDQILIPDTIDELAAILATIVTQLFAYYVAKERGAEIDQPRNLAKSVTVE
jgi:glucosamine--fructose-6-phosphate aminotransferase (isomerizing)